VQMTMSGASGVLLATVAVLLAYVAVPAAGFSAQPLVLSRRSDVLRCTQTTRQARTPALRMKEDGDATKLAKDIGASLGSGLAGFTKSLDDMGAELDAEEAEAGIEQGEKKGLFEDRGAKMKAAMEKDMLEEAGGGLSTEEDVPCPNPIFMSEEDFASSIWKVQVEKNGNYFSGNFVPDEFTMAISNNENQTCEYAGERLTKGKWYMDSSSFYFERRPLGFLGPLSPGMEYFRASITGWTNDEGKGDKLQAAGYVSGYSPLFPTAILGRFLMTKVKSISADEITERRKYAQTILNPPKKAPKLEEAKSMAIDLTDDLSEEERLRVEAAEWVPSTITSTKPDKEEALEDKLGSAFDRIKKTVQDTESFKDLAGNVEELKKSSETIDRKQD